MAEQAQFHIKARKKGAKQWSFVTSTGINHLRIHAKPFYAEHIEKALTVMAEDNPEFEFKKQPV